MLCQKAFFLSVSLGRVSLLSTVRPLQAMVGRLASIFNKQMTQILVLHHHQHHHRRWCGRGRLQPFANFFSSKHVCELFPFHPFEPPPFSAHPRLAYSVLAAGQDRPFRTWIETIYWPVTLDKLAVFVVAAETTRRARLSPRFLTLSVKFLLTFIHSYHWP